jgi:hypothetical protein
MSWWPLPGAPESFMGDAAADAVDGPLLGLAAARDRAGQPKPSVAELARALQDALAVGHFAAAADGTAAAASAAGGMRRSDGMPAADRAADDLVAAVAQALAGLRSAYGAAFDRPPRRAEVLYAFTFALGGRPELLVRPPIPQPITFSCG